jgi:hypothetical protein
MTLTTKSIFLLTVMLLVLAAALDVPTLAGCTALLLLCALSYAYVVALRDLSRSKYRHD